MEECLDFLTEKIGSVSISGPPAAALIDTAGARAHAGRAPPPKVKADWATGGEHDVVGDGLPTRLLPQKREAEPPAHLAAASHPAKKVKKEDKKEKKKAKKEAKRAKKQK